MPLISRPEAVARAKPWQDKGFYSLGAGNTKTDSPFEQVAGKPCCECIKFVLWCFKCRSHDSTFPEYGGDINCDSALMDAKAIPGYDHGAQKFFTEVLEAGAVEPGDLVCFPSVRAREVNDSTIAGTTRIRIGHIGMITGWGREHSNVRDPWNGDIREFSVIECSGGYPAVKHRWDANFHVKENRSQVDWRGIIRTNTDWKTRILRYVGP